MEDFLIAETLEKLDGITPTSTFAAAKNLHSVEINNNEIFLRLFRVQIVGRFFAVVCNGIGNQRPCSLYQTLFTAHKKNSVSNLP